MAGIPTLTPGAVKFLVVHCSASPGTLNVGAREIDRWHRDRGFLKIGYHYVIRLDGTVEEGRKLTERGAHAENFNHCSLGICLVGGVDAKGKAKDTFTQAQKIALRSLLYQLKAGEYREAAVLGHRDLPDVQKSCPSFDVKTWWEHPIV